MKFKNELSKFLIKEIGKNEEYKNSTFYSNKYGKELKIQEIIKKDIKYFLFLYRNNCNFKNKNGFEIDLSGRYLNNGKREETFISKLINKFYKDNISLFTEETINYLLKKKYNVSIKRFNGFNGEGGWYEDVTSYKDLEIEINSFKVYKNIFGHYSLKVEEVRVVLDKDEGEEIVINFNQLDSDKYKEFFFGKRIIEIEEKRHENHIFDNEEISIEDIPF